MCLCSVWIGIRVHLKRLFEAQGLEIAQAACYTDSESPGASAEIANARYERPKRGASTKADCALHYSADIAGFQCDKSPCHTEKREGKLYPFPSPGSPPEMAPLVLSRARKTFFFARYALNIL